MDTVKSQTFKKLFIRNKLSSNPFLEPQIYFFPQKKFLKITFSMFTEICYYRTCREQWVEQDSEETRASFKRALNVGTRLKC